MLLPAGPHLLQAQQVDRQQTRHSLAAALQVGAHVQLKGRDVTRRLLGGWDGSRLLPWQQLRGVAIAKVTWRDDRVTAEGPPGGTRSLMLHLLYLQNALWTGAAELWLEGRSYPGDTC